jgi:hypothetical protein
VLKTASSFQGCYAMAVGCSAIMFWIKKSAVSEHFRPEDTALQLETSGAGYPVTQCSIAKGLNPWQPSCEDHLVR